MLQLQFVILPILTVVLLVVGIGLLVAYYKLRADTGRWRIINQKDWTHQGLLGSGWFISGFGAVLLVVTVILLVPFQPKYWLLTEHTGTIATLSNRFVDGSGDLTEQTYTLTLEGEHTPLVVNDSRVTGLAVGDDITLTCSLQWVYGGADQNNCYIRSF